MNSTNETSARDVYVRAYGEELGPMTEHEFKQSVESGELPIDAWWRWADSTEYFPLEDLVEKPAEQKASIAQSPVARNPELPVEQIRTQTNYPMLRSLNTWFTLCLLTLWIIVCLLLLMGGFAGGAGSTGMVVVTICFTTCLVIVPLVFVNYFVRMMIDQADATVIIAAEKLRTGNTRQIE